MCVCNKRQMLARVIAPAMLLQHITHIITDVSVCAAGDTQLNYIYI